MDLLAEKQVTITQIEILALKKVALVMSVLAKKIDGYTAKEETRTLTKVLVEVINRAEAV